MQQPLNSSHHEDFDKTFEEWISPSGWADFKTRYDDGKHAVSEVYARLACIVFHRSILQKEDVDCCGEEFQLKSSACFRFARRYPSSGTSSSLVLYADCLKEFDRLKTLVDEKWGGLSCRSKVPLDLYMDELWELKIDREPPRTAAPASGGGIPWDPLSTAITCRQDTPPVPHTAPDHTINQQSMPTSHRQPAPPVQDQSAGGRFASGSSQHLAQTSAPVPGQNAVMGPTPTAGHSLIKMSTLVSGQTLSIRRSPLPCQEVPTGMTPVSDQHLEEKKPSPVRRQQPLVANRPLPTLQRPDFDTPVSDPERSIPGLSSLVPQVSSRLEQPISERRLSEPNHPDTLDNESESKPERSSRSGNEAPVLRQPPAFCQEDSPSMRAAAPLSDMAPVRKSARRSSSSRDPVAHPESIPALEPKAKPEQAKEKKSTTAPAGKSSSALPGQVETNTLRRSSRKRTINQYYGHDDENTTVVERHGHRSDCRSDHLDKSRDHPVKRTRYPADCRAQDPAGSQRNQPDSPSEDPNHLDNISSYSANPVHHHTASSELTFADEPSTSALREPEHGSNAPPQMESAKNADASTSQLQRAFRPTRRASFAKANAGLLDDWIQAEEENSLICEDDDDLDELVEVDEDFEEEQEDEMAGTVSDENSTPSSEKKKRAQYRKGQMTCNWDGCGKVFGSHSAYDRHRLAHLGTRPFKCSFAGCSAAFNYGTTLKRHESSHNGVRPFQCDMCDASFVQKYTLQIHLRTHTGEKPFGCPRCDYRTIHKGHVQRHLRKVHNVTDKNYAIVDERELENSV